MMAFLLNPSSGAMWEEKRRKHFKPLKGKYSTVLEDRWTKYRVAVETGMETASRFELENGKLVVSTHWNKWQMISCWRELVVGSN